MRHFIAPLVLLLGWAETAFATEVIPYTDRQIIAAADLVAVGEVTEVLPPPKVNEKEYGYSVARIKLETVFKGSAKPGDSVDVAYWSHGQEKWFAPNKYTKGEKLAIALNSRKRIDDVSNAPPEWAKAAWENHYRTSHDKQMQLPNFRKEAAIWSDPSSHLKDSELRRTAVYFLAVQGKLPDKELIAQIKSSDLGDNLNGAYSAQKSPSHAALKPLVELYLKLQLETEHKNRYLENTNLPAQTLSAIAVIRYTEPEDAELIVKIVPHLFQTYDPLVLQIMASGKQRTAITKLLAEDKPGDRSMYEIWLMQSLDSRAAWPLFRNMPEGREKTALAGQEFKIRNDEQELWTAYQGGTDRAEAFHPQSGRRVSFDKTAAGKVVKLLSEAKPAADPKAAAKAPTEWIVDLFTGSRHAPSMQIWLSKAGAGGVSCLPDAPPLACPELLEMILAANEQK